MPRTNLWLNPHFDQWETKTWEDTSVYPENWCFFKLADGDVLAKWSKSSYSWIGSYLYKLDINYVEQIEYVDTGCRTLLDVEKKYGKINFETSRLK